MTQDEIIRMAREAGFVSPSAAIHQLERFFNLAFEAGAAYEREVCAKESLDVLESLREETIAQCQQGMIEAYKLGQSEEREACAKVCETDELCCKCGDECAAAIRARGEK